MQKLICFLIILSSINTAYAVQLEDAPIEFLIVNALNSKIDPEGHLKTKDPMVRDIFENIRYNPNTDEMILTSNKKTFELRNNLLNYLKRKEKVATKLVDAKYDRWLKEPRSAERDITLYRTNYKSPGFYYVNHVHTNISQDNDKLKFLKISPQKTFGLIERFLRRRRMQGAVALTDHDTDKAYNVVSTLDQSRLNVLRGVEWGGGTHMCLVGIKENWDNLAKGRTYSGEESIRQSRSSEGFRIVNHPNQKTSNFPYQSWLDADGVEVWNSILENAPFMGIKVRPLNNRVAFKQWTDSFKIGRTHTAVSGTDFHFTIPCLQERSLIYPINFIPTSDPTVGKDNAKDYLMAGQSSFTTTPKAPKLTLKAKFKDQKDWSDMGAKLNGSGTLEVNLFGDFSDVGARIGGRCYRVIDTFYRLFTFWKKRTWEMRFYNLNGEVIAKRIINPKSFNYKKHFRAYFTLPITGKEVVRAELWSISKKSKTVDLLGATNPIYINWAKK